MSEFQGCPKTVFHSSIVEFAISHVKFFELKRSKRRKSRWMNNSWPLQSSQNKCGINYWGVVKFIWGGLQQLGCRSGTATPSRFPHAWCHPVRLTAVAPPRPFNACESVHVVRLSAPLSSWDLPVKALLLLPAMSTRNYLMKQIAK